MVFGRGKEKDRERKESGGEVHPDGRQEEFPQDNGGEFDELFDDKGPQKKKPRSSFKIALAVIAGVLVLAVAALGTYGWAFYEQVREPQRVLLDDVTFEETYDVGEVFSEHIVNIALLGFDRGWGREDLGEYLFRPDMLAIFSIDFKKDEVSVVRIPRDSYVPIHGMGGMHDKVNHSFFYGYYYGGGEDRDEDGLRYTLQTVSNVLGGIPIHYYVSVDMYSVIELVDAMGGIYYEVEEPIYDKHWDVGRLLVPEGPQVMDGKTYLRYLQYRGDRGDRGRIDRQMDLLMATFVYLREEGKITDIPTTYRIYKDFVDTDLSYSQIAALAFYARDLDEPEEDLNLYTLPGGNQTKDGIYYLVLNQEERVRIIEKVFGVKAERWPPIVLEDSPEYIEEQERKRREEERDKRREPGWDPFDDDENGQEVDGSDEDETAVPEDSDDLVVVPELRGKTVDEAKAALMERGFSVADVYYRYYNHLEAGLVMYSEPLPGQSVPRGTVFDLVVSDGPEEE